MLPLACRSFRNESPLSGWKQTHRLLGGFFLEVNGLAFKAPEEEVVERTLALAAGAITEADYAGWLEKST